MMPTLTNRLIAKDGPSINPDAYSTMMPNYKRVAIDFDGTINDCWSFEECPSITHAKPRDGALEGLEKLARAGIPIVIWTAHEPLDEVKTWLDAHNVTYSDIRQKISAVAYIDDHAISSKRDWSEITDRAIHAFYGKVKQPEDDWEGLEKLAAKAQPEMEELLKSLNPARTVRLDDKLPLGELEAQLRQPGSVLVLPPPKGRKRAEEKVEDDYGGDWSKLLDINRASIAFDTRREMGAAADILKAAGQVARPAKDRFSEPLGNGYRDYMVNYRLPCGGICEVQLHLKPMLIARERVKMAYDVARAVHASLDAEGRDDMTPAEAEAVRRARKAAKRMYAQAWQECLANEYKDTPRPTNRLKSNKVVPISVIMQAGNKMKWDVCQVGLELGSILGNTERGHDSVWAAVQDAFDFNMEGDYEHNAYRVKPEQRMRFAVAVQAKLRTVNFKSWKADDVMGLCQCGHDRDAHDGGVGTCLTCGCDDYQVVTNGVAEKGILDAGRWLASKWVDLENRYGRKTALAMAIGMLGTLAVPGSIPAIIAAAETIRGIRGYFQNDCGGSVEKAFCPTGEGGKVDNSCSSNEGSGQGEGNKGEIHSTLDPKKYKDIGSYEDALEQEARQYLLSHGYSQYQATLDFLDSERAAGRSIEDFSLPGEGQKEELSQEGFDLLYDYDVSLHGILEKIPDPMEASTKSKVKSQNNSTQGSRLVSTDARQVRFERVDSEGATEKGETVMDLDPSLTLQFPINRLPKK